MPQCRRFVQPNSCYCFTIVTCNRISILTAAAARRWLRDAFQTIRKKYPFTIEGIVLLPDRIHTLWSLPEGDANFSLRWNLIKNRFTKLYVKNNLRPEELSASRSQKRERGIWQRRFWEHLILNEDDFIKHLDYIHYNSVKHGYVKNPVDWEWSSFHR